jgi:hypothetical protein
MNKVWCPRQIENTEIIDDLRDYFFNDYSLDRIQEIYKDNITELSIICDRYEFILKLQNFKLICIKNRKFVKPKLENIVINGTEAIQISQSEKITLDDHEFNGITYDIDALSQYLLLTIIDTIMGQIDYKDFLTWLIETDDKSNYTKDEIVKLYKKYNENNGLRRNFISAFQDHVSEELKTKITESFMLGKIGLGVIDEQSLNNWQLLSYNDRYIKIVKYLYDEIRCKYTHSCSRTFLSDFDIVFSVPTTRKVLISFIDPTNINLISILRLVIQELVVEKYEKKKI